MSVAGFPGRYRFRPILFGHCVALQVQFFWSEVPAYSRHMVTDERWRDATPMDLSDPRLRELLDIGRNAFA